MKPTKLPHLLTVAFAALLFLISAVIRAQDPATSRSVKGKEAAAGSQVIINEVNTEQYPKVRIFVTVLKDGQPVKGLIASDFRVKEDEVDQEPLTAEPKLPALSVVIALDTSGSMSKRMKETKAAAKSFLDTLGETDSAQVVTFAREVKRHGTMSTNRQTAGAAIEQASARGDTRLYDALYESVEIVRNHPGRKAIVLLSDGVDDDGTGKRLSQHSLKEVLALAREVNVPIYVIGLGTEMDEAMLTEVAKETGALYFNAPESSELKSLYARIGAQLAGQYAIRYSSNLPADGVAHRLNLTAQRASDTKEYTAPKGPPPPIETKREPVIETKPGRATPIDQTTQWKGMGVTLNYVRRDGETLVLSYTYKNNRASDETSDQRIGEPGSGGITNIERIFCTDSASGTKLAVIKDDKIARVTGLSGWLISPGREQTVTATVAAPSPEVRRVTVNLPAAPPFIGVAIESAAADKTPRVKKGQWGGLTCKLNTLIRDGNTLQLSYTYENTRVPTNDRDERIGEPNEAGIQNADGIYCVDTTTNTKFSVIKDDKTPRVSGLGEWLVHPGDSVTVSATLSAPPPGTKTVTVYVPCAEPFLQVPIEE